LNFSFYLARFGEDVGCLAAVSLLNHWVSLFVSYWKIYPLALLNIKVCRTVCVWQLCGLTSVISTRSQTLLQLVEARSYLSNSPDPLSELLAQTRSQ
jgi:hypothetical protein